ncbi:MAG: tetratricopeptide repeat protein [Bacteroidota bacterium]
MDKQTVIEDMEEHLRSARIFRNENRFHLAIMELEAALELCEEYKVNKEKRQTLSLLATIYFDLGKNRKSLESYKNALSLAEMDSEEEQIAHIMRHIADVECEIGDLKSSLSHYEKALKYYRSNVGKYSLSYANTIRGFAVLKEKMVDYSTAKKLWKEAKSIYEKLKIETGIKECMVRLKKLDVA